MKLITTPRQTQIRLAGSVLLIASMIFLGTIFLDQALYSQFGTSATQSESTAHDSLLSVIESELLVSRSPSVNASIPSRFEPTATELDADETDYAIDPETYEDELLWFARCILSETKRESEMNLVAWVIRNRVDTRFRGKSSYRDVVLDPFQFSAFNPNHPKKSYYSNLDLDSRVAGWKTALKVAGKVMTAPSYQRPFTRNTRHFYSEQAMRERTQPDWVDGIEPVDVENHNIDSKRFRFFDDVN